MTDVAAKDPTPDPPGLYDEDGEIRRPFVEAVTEAITAHDVPALLELAGDLHEADLGALIEALDHEDRPRLIELMGREFDFAALIEVDDSVREDILDELPTETVAEGMRDLESDDAVAILEDLDREEQAEILEAMPAIDRATLQRSLDYPEYSAGRLMQTTLLTAPPFWTAGQTLDHIHDASDDDLPDSFFEVFVVDPAHHLFRGLDVLLQSRNLNGCQNLAGKRMNQEVTGLLSSDTS
jgi:magnesium transporter